MSRPLGKFIEGKIPPQSLEAEEMVLGAMMLQKDSLEEIIDLLFPECFYRDSHQVIFEAMKRIYQRQEPVDLLSLNHELKAMGQINAIGGPYYLSQLTDRIASTAHSQHHARIILQCYLRRKVFTICQEMAEKTYDESENIFELCDKADADLNGAVESVTGKTDFPEWPDQVISLAEKIRKLSMGEIKISGVPTGSDKLDHSLGGWQKSDLIIIAGRPGAGKTTRVLNFIKAACTSGSSVMMFSLEMSAEQITRKVFSERTEIYSNKLVTGDVGVDGMLQIDQARSAMVELPFHLIDKAAIGPSFITKAIKARLKKGPVDMVVVDYVQLMNADKQAYNASRDTVVGSISRAMKRMAKDFNIPVIILSQLSRKTEERIDKRPLLSDLRESGSLEADADVVIGLYRPGYYYQLHSDRDYKEEPISEAQYKRISELHVLKNRNGFADKFIMEQFFGEFSRFVPENSIDDGRDQGQSNIAF